MNAYKPIKGKIAKIQDKYRVIITIGAEQGVTKNMKFYAYELGDEIIDPDTREVIETEEIVKAHLKVIHVQDKIAILESDETETIVKEVPGILDSAIFKGMYPSTIRREVMKPLNVSTSNEDEIDLTVKVGDYVKSIESHDEN